MAKMWMELNLKVASLVLSLHLVLQPKKILSSLELYTRTQVEKFTVWSIDCDSETLPTAANHLKINYYDPN